MMELQKSTGSSPAAGNSGTAADSANLPPAYRSDTIVSLATPPGVAGVAVVRISGPDALALTKKVTAVNIENKPRHAFLADLIDPVSGKQIDHGLITYFKAPQSYTGEDVVEISTHGGHLTPRLIVQTYLRLGGRQADPGEFTLRAYLNGKLDLTAAEALHQQITSLSFRGQQSAGDNAGGHLSNQIMRVRDDLVNLLTVLERELDFNEDEIESTSLDDVRTRIENSISGLQNMVATAPFGRLIHEGIRIVLAGVPNAGKSSLFNALIGRERAIVTPVPGTTRDSLEAWIEIDGFPVCLVDTAGIHDGNEEVERLGIDRSLSEIEAADIILFLDPKDPVGAARDAGIKSDKTIIPVRSKSDLSSSGPVPARVIGASAIAEGGLDSLHHALVEALRALLPPAESAIVTSDRQRIGLESALLRLQSARECIVDRQPLDIVAGEARLAVDTLADIIGETTSEQVIQEIFSSFCIGK